MTETSYFPESFDEVVRLVVQGQMEAAGIVWDGTLQRLAESAREDMEPLPVGE
jgi:hypothetical protein